MDYPKSLTDVYLHGGKFTDGTADGAIEPSRDPAKWANDVTDEILEVITHGGLTPVEADTTQLRQAIAAMIAAAIGGLSIKQKSLIATAQTFAPGVANGDPVRWDADYTRWAKAQADGTANDLGLGIADITNAEVVLYGETRAGLVAGLSPGAAYYLSSTGTLVTAPATDFIRVGVSKSATTLYVDIDSGTALTGLAYLANANVWAKQQSGSVAILVDGATIAWDLNPGQTAQVTLGGNRILGAPTNQVAGTYYSLLPTQDGTGSRTLAYNAAYKGVTGVTLSTTAGAVDHLVFRSNGAAMQCVSFTKNVGG